MNLMQVRAIAEKNANLGGDRLCFLCVWIIQDLDLNGKLTDWPLDSMDKGIFPVAGKLKHLELEQASMLNRLTK